MANGDQAPWQVKAITTLGITTVLTLGFFYYIVAVQDKKVDRVLEYQRTMTENLMMHGNDTVHTNRLLEDIKTAVQQSCINNAKTFTDRNNCIK